MFISLVIGGLNNPAFIKELDFVIEKDGEMIGSIIYSYVKLKLDGGGVKDFICFIKEPDLEKIDSL